MKEIPLLTAQQMADFAMRPTHARAYQNKLLAGLSEIHEANYVNDVKRLMNQMANQRKGKK